MRTRNISEWATVDGNGVFQSPDGGNRVVRLEAVTEGASFVVTDADGVTTLVGHGKGHMEMQFGVTGTFELLVTGSGLTSILLPWQREPQIGWTNGAPFVQLELKNREEMPPQVKAMFEMLNRNSLLREAQLRADFERKLAAKAAPVST